jgi:hypothetical protein
MGEVVELGPAVKNLAVGDPIELRLGAAVLLEKSTVLGPCS